jgi:hypothetical protein
MKNNDILRALSIKKKNKHGIVACRTAAEKSPLVGGSTRGF